MEPVAIIILKQQDPTNMIETLKQKMPLVFSYDTPTKEEWNKAFSFSTENIIFTKFERTESGFFAGANRNNGLKVAMEKFPNATHYFFFDGDRVPDNLDVKYIEQLLLSYDADCCLFTCEDGDNRAIRRTDIPHGMVDTGCMVSDFYSCGFIISRKACEKILNINNGNLFHPNFNGIWGEEDKFLGIQLDNLGFKTIFSNKPRLGGKPLTNADFVKNYNISLQRRINLMMQYGYPLRPFDKYERLTFINGKQVSIYIGDSL